MAPRPQITGIALCAGVGMLDEGLRAGLDHIGLDYRTVCYVEREAYAAGVLATRMQEGVLDGAPVWSDLVTFDATAWRGRVHFLTAGFPCQPHSVAGKREGLSDERWIWPDIARLAGDLRPDYVWLENVPGLVATGGLDACLASLAALGFDAEWDDFSAAEVGASHQRERLFILAYTKRGRGWFSRGNNQEWRSDVALREGIQPGRSASPADTESNCGEMENPARHERDGQSGKARRGGRVREAGSQLGNAESNGRHEGRPELSRQPGRSDSGGPSFPMVDTGRERIQIQAARQFAAIDQSGANNSPFLFAPGPVAERWASIIADHPHLAPATEPGLRVLADGVAWLVDEHRTDQLRAIGNGVVPLTAATAFIVLARRAGLIA